MSSLEDLSLLSSSLEDDDSFINLKSEDGIIFRISKKYAIISELIKEAISGDVGCVEIPIIGVKSNILEYIVEYMNMKKGSKIIGVCKPLKMVFEQSFLKECVWECKFINKISEVKLHELIMASNYMAINSLLHICCSRIAFNIKGKTVGEIEKILNIK